MTYETPDLDKEDVLDRSHELVSSRLIEGAQVWNRVDGKLGTIHSVMIDKRSGRIAYALLSFGGFLGVGARVYPVPWKILHYEPDFDVYMIDLSAEQLKQGPLMKLDDDERPRPLA